MPETLAEFRTAWSRRASDERVTLSARLQKELMRKIRVAAKRNERSVSEEARAALEWYYLKMWGE